MKVMERELSSGGGMRYQLAYSALYWRNRLNRLLDCRPHLSSFTGSLAPSTLSSAGKTAGGSAACDAAGWGKEGRAHAGCTSYSMVAGTRAAGNSKCSQHGDQVVCRHTQLGIRGASNQ